MEFSSFRYLPLSDFFLFGVSFECYPFRFLPLDFFHLDASLLDSILPGVFPFGFYASNGLLLDVIPFGTLPLDSILPVFSLWGVRPSLYLHLITAFYFCKMGYFTKKRPVFPTKHQWKFPPCYATIRMLGALQSAPNKNVPTERAAIIIWRS